MKTLQISIFLAALLFITHCAHLSNDPIKVMTFNIRYGLADDGLNSWQYRNSDIVNLIKYHGPGIVGLQEALGFQLAYLDRTLENYSWFGAAREDGKRKGEYTAIIYDSVRFKMVHNSTFWLSKTPDKPSLGWDAAFTRTATWAEFRDKKLGTTFFYFNTHFDHKGKIARLESARLLKQRISDIVKGRHIILAGDFNCEPDDAPYKHLTDINNKKSIVLYDTGLISETGHYGPVSTFTGFNIVAEPSEPIDFIFVGDKITVKKHATLSDSFDGRLPSDHYPVLVELLID